MNITVYTKSNCPNCEAAKQLLKSKGLSYGVMDAEDKVTLAALVRDHPGARQMPQIFINGQRVGGLAGLRVALGQMELL